MREQLKSYYADKKMFRRIILVAVFVLIIIFQVSGERKGLHLNDKISFAGEIMPNKGAYILNTERFDREVALAQINEAQFRMIYKRWNLIVPKIEIALKNAGLPDDLKYIPIVESALRENVSSSAGAAGLWQLMPGTAKHYGLLINEYVDERFDIEKSTTAALLYLQDLSKQFDKWTLVAAAYNRGENGLQNSLNSQYSNNYYDLWLNNETSRYVFRILAMKYLWEQREQYFDSDTLGDQYLPFATKTINVKYVTDLAERARKHDIGYYALKKLNPWILKNLLPEGKRNILVFQDA